MKIWKVSLQLPFEGPLEEHYFLKESTANKKYQDLKKITYAEAVKEEIEVQES